MMDNHHLRGTILKLESRLSDDDRKRLHFFLGNDVPRRIRDDPSLGGTLSLMESLFDQDKINEKDFTFLINAFDEIQCMDAVKILRDHMRRIQQANRLNQSIQSLASIIPSTIDRSIEAQDEDKYAFQSPFITQRNISDNTIEMININNTNISPMAEIVDNQSSRSNRKKLLNESSMTQKCLLLFVLPLSIIGLGVLTGTIIIQLQQLRNEQRKQNETIAQLNNLRSTYHQNIQRLTNQLNQCQEEQAKINQTAQELTSKLHQSLKKIQKQNATIHQLKNLRSVDHHNIQQSTNKLSQSLEKSVSTQKLPQLYIPKIPINSKWKQNRITAVGGHSRYELSQFSGSEGIFIDDDQTIYIADAYNNRIVKWKSGETNRQVVAGGNGDGNRIYQLKTPGNVTVDKQNDYLIICDSYNKRVVRWPRPYGTSGETIISDVEYWDVTTDNDGDLYAFDKKKDEVRRWKIGERDGTVVAGGNGGGNRLNQLSSPHNIFVDQDHSVYVSDRDNHRVVKCTKGAKEGIVVAGGHGQGNSLTHLSKPRGIVVDQFGTLYVADLNNHRAMRWFKEATQGSIVIGGNGVGTKLNQSNDLIDLSFDRQNNLYVLDGNNNRVQKFPIELNSN